MKRLSQGNEKSGIQVNLDAQVASVCAELRFP